MKPDIKHIAYADEPTAEYRGLQRIPVLCGKKTTQRHVRPFKTAERAGTCKECQATRVRGLGLLESRRGRHVSSWGIVHRLHPQRSRRPREDSMANFCRVYVKPSAGYWTSRFQWIAGVPCEVGLPHVGDFYDKAEAEAWLKKHPEKYPAGELDFRELDVDTYLPHYVREDKEEEKS